MDIYVNLLSKYGQLFASGLGYTLLLSAITVAFGAILGSLLAMIKMSRIKPLGWLATAFIEIVRGTPMLLQLYFFYFMVPKWISFIEISKFWAITIGLIINSSAYVSEIVRSGIQAVDRGQSEAARSLGMNKTQTMIHIVLPQAVKNILPALGNEFVMVIKETSLASTFFIGDIMTQFRVIQGATYLVLEPLIIVGVIYFLLTFSLSKIVSAFERRMRAGD